MLKIPINADEINPIIQSENFLTVFAKLLVLISGETEEAMLSDRCPLKSGMTAWFEIKVTKLAESNKVALIETDVSALPLDVTMAAKIGINAVIKPAQL